MRKIGFNVFIKVYSYFILDIVGMDRPFHVINTGCSVISIISSFENAELFPDEISCSKKSEGIDILILLLIDLSFQSISVLYDNSFIKQNDTIPEGMFSLIGNSGINSEPGK
jgi:hypothetical protein